MIRALQCDSVSLGQTTHQIKLIDAHYSWRMRWVVNKHLNRLCLQSQGRNYLNDATEVHGNPEPPIGV